MRVGLGLEHRRKGLLWYDTYTVAFEADYRFANPDPVERVVVVRFAFPSKEAIYDGLRASSVNGREAPPATDFSNGVVLVERVAPGRGADAARGLPLARARRVGLRVRARGRRAGERLRARDDDRLRAASTSRRAPSRPSETSRRGDGWTLQWAFESLAAGKRIGIDPPNRLNPGPVTARITFFAPVSLLFFLTVMVHPGGAQRAAACTR